MYHIVACKGEILYTQDVSAQQLDKTKLELSRAGYIIVSCTLKN